MSGSCNGCGDCCNPVVYGRTPDAVRELIDRHAEFGITAEHRAELLWILDNWEYLGPLTDEYGPRTGVPVGQTEGGHAYACRNYDAATRRCRAYETRPDICSGYPWYGGPPMRGKPGMAMPMSPRCGFIPDSRPTLPLIVL